MEFPTTPAEDRTMYEAHLRITYECPYVEELTTAAFRMHEKEKYISMKMAEYDKKLAS